MLDNGKQILFFSGRGHICSEHCATCNFSQIFGLILHSEKQQYHGVNNFTLVARKDIPALCCISGAALPFL